MRSLGITNAETLSVVVTDDLKLFANSIEEQVTMKKMDVSYAYNPINCFLYDREVWKTIIDMLSYKFSKGFPKDALRSQFDFVLKLEAEEKKFFLKHSKVDQTRLSKILWILENHFNDQALTFSVYCCWDRSWEKK